MVSSEAVPPRIHKPLLWQRALGVVFFVLERLVAWTYRCRVDDPHGVIAATGPCPAIFCTWHNRLALSMYIFRRHLRRNHPRRKLAGLVSASRDGALLTAVLEVFGVMPARGSSSRRGGQALLEAATLSTEGYDVAITPDGPRGPCYRFEGGVVKLAQMTGRMVVPVSFELGWKLRLNSWDRFQIPLPFTRVTLHFGKPVAVPAELSEEEREHIRAGLEHAMRAITRD